jgi:hypothetical protein
MDFAVADLRQIHESPSVRRTIDLPIP